jgi:hypothetical protein
MRFVRAEILQWFGLFAAALVWSAQLVIGFGLTVARCSAGGVRWGIDLDTWEILLMVVGVVVALAAEAAALTVFLSTRGLEHDDPPPSGRRHFFASAAALGNVLFLLIILLSGIAVLVHQPCHQS